MASEPLLLQALDVLTEGRLHETTSRFGTALETVQPQALITVRKSARPWTSGPGIQGVGIGQKITDGEKLDELVLKVYVAKKKPRAKAKNPVPKEVILPGIPEPLPTDVEAIGVVALEPNTMRVRPAIPGFSVGHVKITAGTFGCLVRKVGDDKTLYILSNSHVLANEGLAKKGDKILQPGKADGGKSPADVIAELADVSDWVPFQFTAAGYPNLVDAAIAKVASVKDVASAIRLIGVPTGASRTVQRNMQVQKTGRTTDYTIGLVKDINYRTALKYRKPGGGTGRVGFRDQVLCTRYTAPGDSGSAVLNMSKEVVGLHFAGSDSSSIFNRIGHVLDTLQVDVVTVKI
jgi:hypothetical protein